MLILEIPKELTNISRGGI